VTGSGISGSQHRVTLTWKASGSLVVGYNIYRSGTSGGPYGRINSVLQPSTSYVDASVQSGRTYYYVTTAVISGGKESGFSNQVRAVIP
jgi:fibronectin type 3 domain-containing protein